MRIYLFLFSLFFFIACGKEETDPVSNPDNNPVNPPVPSLKGVHRYEGFLSVQAGSDAESYTDAELAVDFDKGTFTLKGWFEMSLEISFEGGYKGKQRYELKTLQDKGLGILLQDKNLDDYDVDLDVGFIEVSENTAEKIAGKYQLSGTDGNGKAQTIEGAFDMPKANPSAVKLQGRLTYKGTLSIVCGSQSETVPNGQIDLDFNAHSFSLSGGDELGIDISFDDLYKGARSYPFAILENRNLYASGTNKNFDNFDWEGYPDPGLIEITENSASRITGTYNFKGKDFDGNARTVRGTFSMVR